MWLGRIQYILYVTLPPEMSRMDTVCYFEIFASWNIALISDYKDAKIIKIGPLVLKV